MVETVSCPSGRENEPTRRVDEREATLTPQSAGAGGVATGAGARRTSLDVRANGQQTHGLADPIGGPTRSQPLRLLPCGTPKGWRKGKGRGPDRQAIRPATVPRVSLELSSIT